MKRLLVISFTILLSGLYGMAQVGVNTDGSQPHFSAMLDVKSSNQGMLIPRMTASQIGSIVSPADGLMVRNTEDGKLYIYVSAVLLWKEVSYGPGTISAFSCGTPYTDVRDSKSYQTVQIGNQCWMRQNLNYGTRINGNQNQENNLIPEKYCYSDFEPSCDIYGGLYQWAELVQYLNGATNTGSWSPVPTGNIQGLCPAGWHIPADDEWQILSNYLGGDPVSGGPLKEAGFDHWFPPNAGATNSSGFTALPGGDRHSDNNYYNMNWLAWFWTASEAYPAVGWYYGLETNFANLNRSLFDKANGFSVRCLHD